MFTSTRNKVQRVYSIPEFLNTVQRVYNITEYSMQYREYAALQSIKCSTDSIQYYRAFNTVQRVCILESIQYSAENMQYYRVFNACSKCSIPRNTFRSVPIQVQLKPSQGREYAVLKSMRYSSESMQYRDKYFPRATYQGETSQVATSQMYNFPSGNFPKVRLGLLIFN